MIDFAAVSTGLKEIDDFEEIAYQPPDNMGADHLSDDDLYSERPATGGDDHHLGALLKSPPITTNNTAISSNTRRRQMKNNKDGFATSTSNMASIKTTANKKVMSNKNIAASKLKQLATKRKHVKQQQQQLQVSFNFIQPSFFSFS